MANRTLADRIKWARLEKGLSQGELAKLAGIKTGGAIGHLETGARKSSMKLAQIAEALGVSAMWLAEGTGDPYQAAPVEQPPSTGFTLEWVSEEEKGLLSLFRSATEQDREFIKQAARHASKLPTLRRNNQS